MFTFWSQASLEERWPRKIVNKMKAFKQNWKSVHIYSVQVKNFWRLRGWSSRKHRWCTAHLSMSPFAILCLRLSLIDRYVRWRFRDAFYLDVPCSLKPSAVFEKRPLRLMFTADWVMSDRLIGPCIYVLLISITQHIPSAHVENLEK